MRARATRTTTTAASLSLSLLLLSAPPAVVRSFSVGPSPIAVTAHGARRGGSIDDGSSARTPSRSRTRAASSSTRPRMSATPFNYGRRQVARRNVRLPLLVDIAEGGEQPRYDVPLPNGHLPPELTTASLYELRLDVPLHRTVIQDAVSSAGASDDSPFAEGGCRYGHVVHSPDDANGLVGSIGCAGEILIGAPSAPDAGGDSMAGDGDDSGPLFVLARGSFRFRVREVVSSIPYPVAIVDELLDDDVPDETESDDHDDDDDDGDVYDTLQSKDLIKEIFQGLERILKVQAEATEAPLSPLEVDILENAPSSAPMEQAVQRRFDAEERIAVFQTFASSLLDVAPDERDRTFAVAMMAGELANLPPNVRARMLVATNGTARLRAVLRELTAVLSLDAARRVTKSLSLGGGGGEGDDIPTDARSLQEAEDEKKQLQVGAPRLPPWADQIQKGARVEYYWNEEEEWCAGTVVADPVKIMEEILLDVKFDDDGSVHKLPFRGDEKARWRPPKGNSGAFD